MLRYASIWDRGIQIDDWCLFAAGPLQCIGIHTLICIHICVYPPQLEWIDLRAIKLLLVLCKGNIGIHALRPVCSPSRPTTSALHTSWGEWRHWSSDQIECTLEKYSMIWATNTPLPSNCCQGAFPRENGRQRQNVQKNGSIGMSTLSRFW